MSEDLSVSELEKWFATPTDFQEPGKTDTVQQNQQEKTAQFERGAEAPAASEKKAEEKPSEKKEEPKKPVTEDEARASAIGYLSLVETSIAIPGMLVLNHRMKKKFSDGEIEKGDALIDKPDALLTPEEKALQNKFARIVNKFEKKKDALRFSEDEKKRAMEPLMQYVKITGNVASPGLLLFCAFVEIVGSRAVDIFTD